MKRGLLAVFAVFQLFIQGIAYNTFASSNKQKKKAVKTAHLSSNKTKNTRTSRIKANRRTSSRTETKSQAASGSCTPILSNLVDPDDPANAPLTAASEFEATSVPNSTTSSTPSWARTPSQSSRIPGDVHTAYDIPPGGNPGYDPFSTPCGS